MRPRFDIDQRVVATRVIRNDGTFPGAEKGEILVQKGERGYVAHTGTFLEEHVIYAVYFESGRLVGCLERELEALDDEGGPAAASPEADAALGQAAAEVRKKDRGGGDG